MVAVIIDGSFVTDEDLPNDIDLIVVLRANHDCGAVLRPFEYNIVSRRQVRQLHRLDVLIGRDGDKDTSDHVLFFSRVRDRPELRKGMLRIGL